MAQGSFSAQLRQQQATQSSMPTRTQRKSYQYQQETIARQKFEALRSQAEELKNTEFKDITFEQYEQKYSKLSPEIQQFFLSPQEIIAQREQTKQVERTNLNSRISETQNRLVETQKELADLRNWIRENNKPTTKYKDEINNLERDIHEYQDQIIYAQQNAGKIEQGASASDIFGYAKDKASYNRDKSEARAKSIAEFNKSLSSGKLDQDLNKLGVQKQNLTYDKFIASIEKFNKDVAYIQQLQKWGEKIGFEKLPEYAKAKINPSAVEWQKANPTEKLIFDKQGNVTGVQSGKLGKNLSIEEYNKIASKTPENYYKEWQTERLKKPFYLDLKQVDITLPYESKMTINVNANKTKLFPITISSETTTDLENKSFITKARDFLAKYTPSLKIPIFIGAGGNIKVEDLTKEGSKSIETTSEKIYNKMVAETPNKLNIDTALQEEYQTRFEDAYMKKMLLGEINFDTASAEFEKSNTAKIISQKYSTSIIEDTKKFPLLTKWKYGVQLTALSLAGEGVKLIPKNYGELVVESALVYSGIKALSYIPASVNLATTGAFFSYGTYKAFSPTSTPSEAGAGLLTSAITGVSLGYAGIKYLRSPVIKTKPIPPKKTTLYSTEAVGKDVKIVTDKATYDKAFYGEQKLSQVTQAGRRTIVTTKWRDLLNRYVGLDMKNIYEGIPTSQRAIYGTDVFRGTRYKFKISGYENALKKLKDYGWTTAQTKATLRYYAPRLVEQWLKRGVINIKDLSATGKFTYETRKLVFDIDRDLGIKTKGGRTIKDVYTIKRKIFEINDKQFMLEVKKNVETYLNKAGKSIKIKEFGLSTSISSAKISDTFKGAEWLRKENGLDIYKMPSQYKNIYSLSRETFSLTLTPKRKKLLIEALTNQRKYNLGKSTLFDLELDLKSKIGGNRIIQKGSFGGTSNVENAIKDISEKSTSKAFKTDTSGGIIRSLKDHQTLGNTQQLKVDISLDQIKQTKIGAIPKVRVETLLGVKEALVMASALNLQSGMKLQMQLKSILKEKTQLKTNQIEIQQTRQLLKTQQVQKVAQTLRFRMPTFTTEVLTQKIKTPTFKFPPTKTVPFLIFKSPLAEKIKEKLKKKRSSESLGLFPDFTARAIGLAPKQVSLKQALKEMSKIQTGFEVRTGARIKGFRNVQERQLMAGIMK